MIKSFDTLYNNDEPQDFLPAVKLLHGLLEEYDLVVDNMQRAFLNNPRVSNFYRDVASTLRCIFENIMVSDIDD